jgi:hypothetical protein
MSIWIWFFGAEFTNHMQGWLTTEKRALSRGWRMLYFLRGFQEQMQHIFVRNRLSCWVPSSFHLTPILSRSPRPLGDQKSYVGSFFSWIPESSFSLVGYFKGHSTHEPRAVTMKLWEPKRKCPKVVPTHLQNHVVWSRILKRSVKSYVTGPSTICYFNQFPFMRVLTHDKME